MFSEQASLVNPREPSRTMKQSIISVLGAEFASATLQTSGTTRVNKFEHASVGDIVLVGHADPPVIGRIVYHISVQVHESIGFASLVEEFMVIDIQNRCWKCKATGAQTLFDMSDIVCSLTWAGTNVLSVLKPLHVMSFARI